MEAKYVVDILNGKYGEIKAKHFALAEIMRNKDKREWADVRDYVQEYSMYDDLTLRDIDKVAALLSKDQVKVERPVRRSGVTLADRIESGTLE